MLRGDILTNRRGDMLTYNWKNNMLTNNRRRTVLTMCSPTITLMQRALSDHETAFSI